jgi:hypothetical protein
MYPAEYALRNLIRQSLYNLKRQYGGTIDVYRLTTSAVDQKTGVVSVTRQVTRINRAVVLPSMIHAEIKKSISQISANKMFVVGGQYDAATRNFIIDRQDGPDLQLTLQHWIVYRNRKFEIKQIQEFEFEAGWIVTTRELIGEVPEQILELSADNLLILSQSGEGV